MIDLTGLTYNNGSLYRNGRRAGSIRSSGYRRITIKGKSYREHHIVWLIHHGRLPSSEIDHIDRDKTNNKIENLRETNRYVNMHNITKASKNNKVGYRGVGYDKKVNKYHARIQHKGTSTFLGMYDTAKLAHQAYLNHKEKLLWQM